MTSRRVSVVQVDIDRGIRGDSSRCVVATAIARAFPGATNIEVDTQTIRFTEHGQRVGYLTPLNVQNYVVAFDAGDPIQPLTFTLDYSRRVVFKRRVVTNKPVAAAAKRAAKAARASAGAAKRTRSTASVEHIDAGEAVMSAELPGKVDYTGIKTETISEPGARKATPRVFKTKRRSYGHRILRINQPMAETGGAS